MVNPTHAVSLHATQLNKIKKKKKKKNQILRIAKIGIFFFCFLLNQNLLDFVDIAMSQRNPVNGNSRYFLRSI